MKQKAISTITILPLLFFCTSAFSATTFGIGVATGIQNITWEQNKSTDQKFKPFILSLSSSGKKLYGLLDIQFAFNNSSNESWEPFGPSLPTSTTGAANDYNKENLIIGYRLNGSFSIFGGFHHDEISKNIMPTSYTQKVTFKNDGLIVGGTYNSNITFGDYNTGFVLSASFGNLDSEFFAEDVEGTSAAKSKYINFGAKWTFPVYDNFILDLGYSSSSSSADFGSLTIGGIPVNPKVTSKVSSLMLQGTVLF